MRHTLSRIIFMLFLMGMLTLPSRAIILSLDLNIDNLTATQQTAQLILETDRRIYLLGENVTVILKNVGNSSVRIGGFPAWQIFTYPEEEPVYPKIFATLAWGLEPGENNTFIWNQYNQFNESSCIPGTYIVKDTQGWDLSALFQIAPSTPTPTPTPTAIPTPTPIPTPAPTAMPMPTQLSAEQIILIAVAVIVIVAIIGYVAVRIRKKV